jgi:adenosylcobyric acid synthase
VTTTAGALLVAGTTSDAGKSMVVAGLCRLLARKGIRVAPFKAQNMSNNSAVTVEGGEIGRAQAMQARAAGLAPSVRFNPVLLKPGSDRTSQLVVRGTVVDTVGARDYFTHRERLATVVADELRQLRTEFDAVIVEGAGSPAEINLRATDIANMGLARAAHLPVVIVGDIDRGGLLAHLYGTVAVLEPDDQRLICGFLVNKFRGDRAILAPGLDQLGRLTGRPVLGVLPWRLGLRLDAEDSVELETPTQGSAPSRGADPLQVAVVRLPWLSDFTDFDPLAAEPGVSVRFTAAPAEVLAADLAVVPGTKATAADLGWLRRMGLDRALAERAACGLPTLGICGGYQLLGRRVVDRVESGVGEVAGLSLLPVETVFEATKVLINPVGTVPWLGGVPASGYEIHHGRTRVRGGEPALDSDDGDPGCRRGAVVGLAWHGIFEGDDFRRAFLGWVAAERSLDWVPGTRPFAAVREQRLDALGDLIADHTDTAALERLLEEGAPPGLPFVPPGPPA